MNRLRYKFGDRFAETKGYDGFAADKDELNNFFEQKVKGKLGDHRSVGWWCWPKPTG